VTVQAVGVAPLGSRAAPQGTFLSEEAVRALAPATPQQSDDVCWPPGEQEVSEGEEAYGLIKSTSLLPQLLKQAAPPRRFTLESSSERPLVELELAKVEETYVSFVEEEAEEFEELVQCTQEEVHEEAAMIESSWVVFRDGWYFVFSSGIMGKTRASRLVSRAATRRAGSSRSVCIRGMPAPTQAGRTQGTSGPQPRRDQAGSQSRRGPKRPLV
jgi:hypothetical protein